MLKLGNHSRRSQTIGTPSQSPPCSKIRLTTQIKGIGEWSVQMLLMFQLQRWDILPVGDVGIQLAMRDLYQLAALPKPTQMREIAAPWAPYRTIACWYLWRSRDSGNQVILQAFERR
jgi:3-methyladenine DNA glycosylase/8-oxoguanine DNA glycosylase